MPTAPWVSGSGPKDQPPSRSQTLKVTFEQPGGSEGIPTGKCDTNALDDVLTSASDTVNKSSPLSKAQQRLDKIEDYIQSKADNLSTASSFAANTASGSVGTISIDSIQSNITGWAESSKVLMNVLDGLASAHPAIAVAVLAFKAVVTLEMKRRENDNKVIALHLQMQDMMSTLLQLRGIENADEKGAIRTSLTHRLEPLMIKVAHDITKCGNTCDAYSKKNLIVKVLKGPIYEQRLSEHAITFSDRQREIQFALMVHTSLTVEASSQKIQSIHERAASADDKISLALLFRRLDSPNESKLIKTIEAKGGAENCMKSDEILSELLELRWRLRGEVEQGNVAPMDMDDPYRHHRGSQSRSRSHHASGSRLYGTHTTTLAQPSRSMAPGYSGYPSHHRPENRHDAPIVIARRSSESIPYVVPPHPPQTSYIPQPSYQSHHVPDMTYIPSGVHRPRARSHSVVVQPPSTQYRTTTSRYHDGIVPGDTPSSAILLDLNPLKQELAEDVDQVLDQNMTIFVRKLDVQKKELLLEMSVIVKTQTDRVIRTIDSGPYERIEDEDIRTIWKEMGWRTSVKARTFVFSLHTYFTERYHDTDPLQKFLEAGSPQNIQDFRKAQLIANKKAGDREALDHINILNLHVILESFDDDSSGYVTIREVNNFTSHKPAYMSMPEWISYWAIGWHFVLCEYKSKICGIISNIYEARQNLLPANRLFVHLYLENPIFQKLDLLLDSLNPYNGSISDALKLKHQRYATDEENRIEGNLNLMGYQIDVSSTLTLVAGAGRIEKYLFLLLFLVLRHHLRIIRAASRYVLHEEELITAIMSIEVIFDAVEERIRTLQTIYQDMYMTQTMYTRLPNNIAFGMLAKLSDTGRQPDISLANLSGRVLRFGINNGPEDIIYGHPLPNSQQRSLPESSSSIEGTWSGYSNRDGATGFMQVTFVSVAGDKAAFEGSGEDFDGTFEISRSTSLARDFFSLELHRTQTPASGVLGHRNSQPVFGKIRSMPHELVISWESDAKKKTVLYPGSADLVQSRYSGKHDGLDLPSAKARWSFVCNATLNQVRRDNWMWSYLKDRRDKRLQYIDLYRRKGDNLTSEETLRLKSLENTIAPWDIRFYRSVVSDISYASYHINVTCEYCNKDIIGDRYICVGRCLNHWSTTDLCMECVNTGKQPRQRGFSRHKKSHPLAKFALLITGREIDSLLSAAKDRVVVYPLAPQCAVCPLEDNKPPYWSCIVCPVGVVTCANCDPIKIHAKYPDHHVLHPMVCLKIPNRPELLIDETVEKKKGWKRWTPLALWDSLKSKNRSVLRPALTPVHRRHYVGSPIVVPRRRRRTRSMSSVDSEVSIPPQLPTVIDIPRSSVDSNDSWLMGSPRRAHAKRRKGWALWDLFKSKDRSSLRPSFRLSPSPPPRRQRRNRSLLSVDSQDSE